MYRYTKMLVKMLFVCDCRCLCGGGSKLSRLDNILTLVCNMLGLQRFLFSYTDRQIYRQTYRHTRVCILLFKTWLSLSSPSGHTQVRQLHVVLNLRSFNGRLTGFSGEEYFAVYIFPSVRVSCPYQLSCSFPSLSRSFFLSFFLLKNEKIL